MVMAPGPQREKLCATSIEELSLVKAVDLVNGVQCARAAPANSTARTMGEPVFQIGNKSEIRMKKCSVKCVVEKT